MEIKIDKQILPLITAMNNTGWIETVSSCQGHPGHEYFPKPYVAFFCKSSKISDLCKILNQIETDEEDIERVGFIYFDLSIVHNDQVNGCQEEAKRGWLALNLNIETNLQGPAGTLASAVRKREAFCRLAKLFEQQAPACS